MTRALSQNTPHNRRPLPIWLICLPIFVLETLLLLDVLIVPLLVSDDAEDILRYQVTHTIDPSLKAKRTAELNYYEKSKGPIITREWHEITGSHWLILEVLLELAGAVLLFQLRRLAQYFFLGGFAFSLIGNISTGPNFLGGRWPDSTSTLLITVIWWAILAGILCYTWLLQRKGLLH